MINIAEVPQLVAPAPFPTTADRSSKLYNGKAKTWADKAAEAAENQHAIGTATHQNAIAARELAQAAKASEGVATDKARIATEQADAALGYRNTAGQHAEAARLDKEAIAGSARTAAQAAQSTSEDAAAVAAGLAAIAGGPVASVQGKPGPNPRFALADFAAMATLPEMQAGTEPGERVMSPGLVHAAVLAAVPDMAPLLPAVLPELARPGEVRFSLEEMSAPDWVRCGAQYLASAYPKTDRRIGRRGFTGASSKSLSPAYWSQLLCVTPDGTHAVIREGATIRSVFVQPDGALTAGEAYGLNAYGGINVSASVSDDAQYLFITYDSSLYDSDTGYVYRGGGFLLQRTGTTWSQIASVTPLINVSGSAVVSAMSSDGSLLFMARGGNPDADPPIRVFAHNLATHAITPVAVDSAVQPPARTNISAMNWHKGKLLAAWSSESSQTPSYAVIYSTSPALAKVATIPTGLRNATAPSIVTRSFDRSVVVLRGDSSFTTIDMEKAVAGVVGATTSMPGFAFLPDSDANRLVIRDQSSGFYVFERDARGAQISLSSSIAGYGSADGYLCPLGPEAVLTLLPATATARVYYKPATFTLNPSGVIAAAGAQAYPAAPYAMFMRSYDGAANASN